MTLLTRTSRRADSGAGASRQRRPVGGRRVPARKQFRIELPRWERSTTLRDRHACLVGVCCLRRRWAASLLRPPDPATAFALACGFVIGRLFHLGHRRLSPEFTRISRRLYRWDRTDRVPAVASLRTACGEVVERRAPGVNEPARFRPGVGAQSPTNMLRAGRRRGL